MHKQVKGFITGVVFTTLLLAGTITALAATQSIQVSFDNIKVAVDGKIIAPKDANGNAVEPFIYNGTTYLPIRAIGEAIGKDVSWDQATKTAYLGGAPSTGSKYYVEVPTVLDFGTATGATLLQKGQAEKGNFYEYAYESLEKDQIEEYGNLLMADGFSFKKELSENDTGQFTGVFERNGLYVMLVAEETGFNIYIVTL